MDCPRRTVVCLALGLVALRPLPSVSAASRDGLGGIPPAASPPVAARPAQGWPVPIVPNRGQADPAASHVLLGDDTIVLFAPDGLSLRRITPGRATADCRAVGRVDGLCRAALSAPPAPDPLGPMADGGRLGDDARGRVDAVGWRFVGAQTHAAPFGEAPTGGRLHMFRGRPAEWRTNLPFYQRLVYRAVWPGIDVVFDGGPDVLKHTFIVAAGADPGAIALSWHGAARLSLDDAGALVVDTADGRIVDAAPAAFQVVDGRRVPVAASYALRGRAADGGWPYAFHVGDYDPALPLYIDPALVVSAGFVGGAGADRGLGVELADDGHIWMVGELGDNAYAARVSPDGRRLLNLSVFDADSATAGFDVDVDAAGSPYVVGAATAGEASFPVRRGPDLSYNGGGADAFVAKLAPDGSDIVYAGFLGGAGVDFAEGVAVDALGHAYVHGLAESTEATFPVVIGPDLTQNGAWDAFVAKIVPAPDAPVVERNLVWSGFVGGAGYDVDVSEQHYSSGHIAIDGDGNLYLSGQTDSREDSFPDGDGFGDLPGPDRTHNGGWDAYVAKIKADGTGLAYAGYIGGAFDDVGKGMAVDASGAAYLTGHTMSAPDTFPAAVGPDLTYAGRNDGFVAKVTPDGTRLAFCGYFGGDDDDSGQAVALGPDGALYLAGYTESTEATFPLVGGPDLTHNGPQGDSEDLAEFDVLVGRLKFDVGAADPRRNWDFLGLVGGAGSDGAFWLDVDGAGDVVVVGDTDSDSATFPDVDGRGRVPGLPDEAHGLSDAFVVQVAWRPPSRRVAYLPWAGRSVLADVARATAPALPFEPTASSTPEPTFRSPTATASPTAPPVRPTAVPPGESLVFWDDFGDPASGWRRFFLASGTVGYVDGMLELATRSGELAVAHAPGVHFGDGAVELTLQRGSGADALAGVVFGPRTGTHFWWLFPDGGQLLVLRNGDGVRALSPVQSAGITDPRAPVRLRFERDGSRMRGYADGALMFDADDPSLHEPGVVGVALDAPDLGTARVRFDDVLVTRWVGARPTAAPATATATPAPTDTPPPGGRVLFRDDFDDPTTGWLVIDNASALARYVDGEYELTARAEGIYLAAFARGVRCADCAVEVSARFVSTAFGRLGIALGERDPDVTTFVELAPDGRYAIERAEGARWTTLAGPAASGAIRSGANAVNRLRVERRNGRLTLVANGTTVVAVDVPGLGDAGQIGLVVLSDEPGIAARFDDFVVSED